jgi:hypothetical protein
MRMSAVATHEIGRVTGPVDLLICACGYESRAIRVAQMVADRAQRKIALGFEAQRVLCYETNKRWFQENGFQVEDVDDVRFGSLIAEAIQALVGDGDAARLLVDVSCMNRARLAKLVLALRAAAGRRLEVDFAYNIAAYSAPSEEVAPTSVAEPVTPEFSGWTLQPEKPPAAVLGLGYEQSRAIGIVDHLEINNAAWAFIPKSPIPEYSISVDLANESLYSMLQTEGRRLYYEVMDPGALFRELNALVDLLKQMYNPIVIPFGPKIFALTALLVASLHEDIGVWRVSSGLLEEPVDRAPSEYTAVLHAEFVAHEVRRA